jgi:hypothetical protein
MSSESSESVSERASLLGPDSKQVESYKSTEMVGGAEYVVAEGESMIQEQKTPKAIAAVIGVLLVGSFSTQVALQSG